MRTCSIMNLNTAVSRGEGSNNTTRTTGSRPNTSTFRSECSFQIRLRVTKDGQYLEIVTMNKDHNHDINSASFNLHPARRILANEEKQQVS